MNDLVIKKWLNYWKNNLADADRTKIDITTNPIQSTPSNFISQVPNSHAKYLWITSKADKNDQFINVVIAPCRIGTEYEHAKCKSENEHITPFWIPAEMDRQGNLSIKKDKNNIIDLPFFIREYLSPNPDNTFTIASVAEVDEKKSNHDFNQKTWKDYWQTCEKFFQAVTSQSFTNFDTFTEKEIYVELSSPRNTTGHVLKLYNQLEKQRELPLLLQKIANGSKTSKQLLNNSQVQSNTLHIAQMNGDFPLSVSQRQSMATFCQQENSDVLAINGPPGTGKTTILQSFLANIFVQKLIDDEPPALILASSTNNQAITNILDSFAEASDDQISERWLPDLDALGLYLTGKKSSTHQVMSSNYGNGFFQDYEKKPTEDLTKFFLQKFNKHYQATEETVEGAFLTLKQKTRTLVQETKHCLLIAKEYENLDLLLMNNGFDTHEDLKNTYADKQQVLLKKVDSISQLQLAEQTIISESKKLPWYYRLIGFLSSIKQKKALLFQSKVAHLPLIQNNAIAWHNHEQVVMHIQKQIIDNQTKSNELNKEIEKLKQLQQKITATVDKYLTFKQDWQQHYQNKLDKLHKKTGDEYQNLSPLEETNVMLDISYRFESFWTAVHVREAEYIMLLEQRKSKSDKERIHKTYKEKLQRFACLTPVFISTFHSAPKFFDYFSKEKGENFAYFDLLDYLIVDEAGQVSPEIALPTFSLAKQAVVVGDTLQIEPIWSVSEQLDGVITHQYSLTTNDDEFGLRQQEGLLSSSGSVMKLAQRACDYQQSKLAKGMMLKEHRRCLDSIISYSNRYIYANELLPKQGNEQKKGLNLPTKGYLHISNDSQKQGSSRVNKFEATIIAKWIEEQSPHFIEVYNKPIEEIVAVVTPYKTQAGVIKQQLRQINPNLKKITCGTVNSLQGAERPIVIFSLVVSMNDSTNFINSGYNMLNVAISRAKHSFLVFGNMDVLHAEQNTPLGNLKKWLLERDDAELSSNLVFKEREKSVALEQTNEEQGRIRRIDSLDKHIEYLNNVLSKTQTKLIITSPFLSIHALNADNISNKIQNLIDNNVEVIIYTDKYLDVINGKIKPHAQEARRAIKKSGASLKVVSGIHNKTIIMDDKVLVEGSFNWLSATRNKNSPFYREESSICLTNDLAKPLIERAKKRIEHFDTQQKNSLNL